MEAVKLVDIINSKSAVSPRAGMKAYDYIVAALSDRQRLDLSFEGIEDLTSAFCNSSIGKLYMNYDPQLLNSLLHFTGIDKDHVWFKKIQNAILLGTNENARTIHNENLAEVIFA